jgi:hypothetical protein
MTAPVQHPEQTLDLACARCAYALRGLDPSGRCPECGMPIPETISLASTPRFLSAYWLRGRALWDGPPLAEADPRWRRRVAWGIFALALTMPLLGLWLWRKRWLGYWDTVPDYGLLAVFGWFTLSAWLLTWPEPPAHAAAAPDPLWRGARWLIRALAPLPPLAAGLAAWSERVPAAEHAFFARAGFLALLPLPALVFLMFDYLAYLAARVPATPTAIVLRLLMLGAAPYATFVAAAVNGRRSGWGYQVRVPELTADVVEALLRGCFAFEPIIILGVFGMLMVLASRVMSAGRSRA